MSAGSTPRRRWAASTIVAVATAILCVGFLIMTIALDVRSSTGDEGLGEMVVLMFAFYLYLLVGLVLLVRRPDNRLGWVMVTIGALTAVGSFSGEYAGYTLTPPGRPLPGATLAAWINQWWWYPTISCVFLFVPLLFPEGRPLSRRWAWLTRFSFALVALITITSSLAPMLRGDFYSVPNPIGVPGISDVENGVFGAISFGLLIGCMLAALVGLVLRFRRSRGVERQQMKWFVAAAAAIICLIVVEETAAALGYEHVLPESNIVFGIAVGLLPVAMGIAVLRYRLYDIDRIVSRTLSYLVLTALLLVLYLAAVTAITTITAPVAGESPIAVAAATLLAAAAFGPLRRRIQGAVDRRFNRARYNAAATVADLRGRLRDEVDLRTLTGDLLAAVDESVQPQRTMLWLREPAETQVVR